MKASKKEFLSENQCRDLLLKIKNDPKSPEGEKAIFDLCENFKFFILKVVGAYFGSHQDLIQDGEEAILESINNFEESGAVKFKEYIMSSIRKKIGAVIRQRKRETVNIPLEKNKDYADDDFEDGEDDDMTDVNLPSNDFRLEKITGAFSVLNPDEKKVIELSFYENLSIREVSKSMNLPWRKVHALKLSAILKLRDRIEGNISTPERTGTLQVDRWSTIFADILGREVSENHTNKIKDVLTDEEKNVLRAFHSNQNLRKVREELGLSREDMQAIREEAEDKIERELDHIETAQHLRNLKSIRRKIYAK